MKGRMEEMTITRRAVLRVLGAVGLSAAALPFLGPPPPARAQGNLANLVPEEPVEATLKRLFAGRPLKDGSSAIKLELPIIAENGAVVPISVEVTSPMTPPSASISRTRWPLAMPPMAGLQDIWAIRSRFIVMIAVFSPRRAHARAASQPACPAPTTITS